METSKKVTLTVWIKNEENQKSSAELTNVKNQLDVHFLASFAGAVFLIPAAPDCSLVLTRTLAGVPNGCEEWERHPLAALPFMPSNEVLFFGRV